MGIRCKNCGTENNGDCFWCENCNSRLVEIKDTPVDEKVDKIIEEKFELPEYKAFNRGYNFAFSFKIPFLIIICCILIFSTYHVASNLGKGEFDWDKYGGCPWNEDDLPWDYINFPWTDGLSFYNIKNSWDSSYSFSDIGKLNEDYWFEGDSIKTNSGWTFTYSKVKDINYQARVLNYYVYNKDGPYYNPSEIFSQVDILFGFEDIVNNPNKYSYTVTSNFYRGVYVSYPGENSLYFREHITNTHLIPHSQEVIDTLKSIDIGDVLTLTGSYVNVYGTHNSESRTYTWTTDTEIGNNDCEVILVENLIIH